MQSAISFVFTIISSAVSWLISWEYLGIPFLYYLIGLAVIGMIMRFAL